MAGFGLAETAELAVRISLKDDLSRGIGALETRVGRLSTTVGKIGTGLRTAGRNLVGPTLVAGGLLGVAIKGGLDDLSELESAVTSVDGAIKQMGLTGKITGAQVADWANEIEADIGAAFDDKAITAAATTLIRFGKVTDKNLRPALQVVADLATKTGDVDSAATLLAKALADPEKAAGKLARSGVVLTKQQQEQIKTMVEAGDVAGAQALLLDEVTKATEGAAKASQGKYARAMSVLGDVQEDARKALAEGFLPVIEKVAKLLSTELAKPQTLANIREFGQSLAAGLDGLIEIARNLPWGTIGDSLRIAGQGAKTILSAFTSLPDWLQTAVLTGWGLNKLTGGLIGDLASGLIKGVLGMTAGVVNINAGVVNGAGGLGSAPRPAGGGSATGKLGGLNLIREIGKIAIPAAILTEGLIISGESISEFAAENNRLAAQAGLNAAEIEAVKYYRSTGPEQQLAFKRLGRIPSKADFDSGMAKLNATVASSAEVSRQATTNATANASSIASREAAASQQRIDNLNRTVVVAQAANSVMMTVQGAMQAARDAIQTQATRNAEAAARTAGVRAAGATNASASRIVGAIWASGRANRTTVQPTNVIERYTTIVRGGATSGSRSGPLV